MNFFRVSSIVLVRIAIAKDKMSASSEFTPKYFRDANDDKRTCAVWNMMKEYSHVAHEGVDRLLHWPSVTVSVRYVVNDTD